MASFAIVLLFACASASARSVVIPLPPGFAPIGPVQSTLAGTNVVYRDPWDQRDNSVLRIVSKTGRDTFLANFRNDALVFAGSSSRLVIAHRPGCCSSSPPAELLAGPPAGPLAVVSSCAGPSLFPAGVGHGFAVEGDELAYLDNGCGAPGSSLQLIVRSLASGAPAPTTFSFPSGADVSDVVLAGPWVAYHLGSAQHGEIVLDDWHAGTEALRVPDGAIGSCGAAPPNATAYSFCGIALQSDGKLARLLGSFYYYPGGPDKYDAPQDLDNCDGTLDWLSATDPHWHRLTARACASVSPWMAGDRVLFAPPTLTIQPLGVIDLGGTVRSLGDAQSVYGFDGRAVLVDEASCSAMALVSQSVLGDDPPLPFIYGNKCPMRFSKPRLFLGSRPRFVVTVSCPHGCRGPLVSGTGDWVEGHSPDFTLAPGQRKRITVPLPPRGVVVQQARRHQRLKLALYTFDVTSYNPRGSPEDQASYNTPTAHVVVRPMRSRARERGHTARRTEVGLAVRRRTLRGR